MQRVLKVAGLLCALLAVSQSAALAQSFADFQRRAPLPETAGRPAPIDPYATPGAVIYVCDSKGILWTVTLGTYTLHKIGSLGTVLTDIAFNPKDGKLYGVSFTSFYTVSTSSGKATGFGSTSLNDINALVFDKNGIGYFEGFTSAELYGVNIAKKSYGAIGPTGSYKSAGDLSFYNGALVLSGFTGSLGSGTKETIVKLSTTTGKVLATAPTDIVGLYGLTTIGGNTLYGFANESLYKLDPSAKTVSARAVLLKNFKSEGLNVVEGAAYKGDT